MVPHTWVEVTAATNASLAQYLTTRREEAAAIGPEVAEAARLLTEFVIRGGKRVRPAFAWAGWLSLGGAQAPRELTDLAIRAFASLELIQACALIHDDIIDASSTRRGFPTTEVESANIHRDRGWAGAPEEFGRATAILIGDLALAWADDMFTRAATEIASAAGTSIISGSRGGAASPYAAWEGMRTEVLGGQILDITNEASGSTDADAAERVVRYKTASYTVERPLHLGATLALTATQNHLDSPVDAVDGLRSAGVDIGVAFQLRDDLLGAFGNPDVTGKPSGDDLISAKRTPLLATAASGDPAAWAVIAAGIGTPMTPDTLERVRAALHEIGAVRAIEDRIARHTASAHDEIEAIAIDESGRTLVRELADALAERTR